MWRSGSRRGGGLAPCRDARREAPDGHAEILRRIVVARPAHDPRRAALRPLASVAGAVGIRPVLARGPLAQVAHEHDAIGGRGAGAEGEHKRTEGRHRSGHSRAAGPRMIAPKSRGRDQACQRGVRSREVRAPAFFTERGASGKVWARWTPDGTTRRRRSSPGSICSSTPRASSAPRRSLVVWGGGNTSIKLIERDHRGREVRVLRVKGSGSDLKSDPGEGLPRRPHGRHPRAAGPRRHGRPGDGDYLRPARQEPGGSRPSIETLLHGFLPARR